MIPLLLDGAIDAGPFDETGSRAIFGPALTTGDAQVRPAVSQTIGGDLIMHGADAVHVLVNADFVALSPTQAREYALQILAVADLGDTWAGEMTDTAALR